MQQRPCGMGVCPSAAGTACRASSHRSCSRPLLHALVSPGVAAAYGVEIDRIKCDKAAAFVRQTDTALRARGAVIRMLPLPAVQCAAVEQVDAPPVKSSSEQYADSGHPDSGLNTNIVSRAFCL